MNLHHLKIFLAVAETGSFSKASETLHISQPAVSVQVKKLEEDLGIPLLEHFGKATHLTTAGIFLRDQARHLFRLAEEIEEQMAELRGIKTGSFRLGASTSPGTYLLPSYLSIFQVRFPQVSVSLQIGNTHFIENQLLSNTIDLAILGEEHSPVPELVTENLFQDRLILIGAPNHPLANNSSVTWEEVINYPFVFREVGSNTREIFEKWLKQRGYSKPVGTELVSTEASKRMVASGKALAVTSYLAVGWELDSGHLAQISLSGFELQRSFCLAQHKDKRLTPLISEFKRFLRDSLIKI